MVLLTKPLLTVLTDVSYFKFNQMERLCVTMEGDGLGVVVLHVQGLPTATLKRLGCSCLHNHIKHWVIDALRWFTSKQEADATWLSW